MRLINTSKIDWKTVQRSVAVYLVAIAAVGCTQGPPTVNPTPPSDPAGLGTPQERLKILESNTTMSPELKARRMKLLQDQINNSHSAPH